MNAELAELLAKQEITEVLHRFCRGCDRQDWDLLRDCFHPDAHDDHAIFQGDRESLIAWLTEFLGSTFSATMHSVTNILISVDGDTAGSESHVHAWHRFKAESDDAQPRDLVAGARYVDRFECRGGRWAIVHRVVVMDWAKIETQAEGFELGAGAVFSRTDRDDVSYSVLTSVG